MAKASREERMLDTLRGAADAGPAMLREVVQKALADSSGAVVARAATLVREEAVADVTDDLQAALTRLMRAPAKADPGCGAKTALVATLRHRDAGDAESFRTLAAWTDGDADGASVLRAEAAFALVGAGDAEAPRLLVDLLFRRVPEHCGDNPSDRLAAARGFGELDWPPAALVLRAKLHAGDREPAVLGECCGAVARLDPPWAHQFVGDWLMSHPAVVADAAVPLGESRRPWAFDLLARQAARPPDDDARPALCIGLALTRDARAAALLRSLADQPASRAAALEALKLLPHAPSDA